MLEDFRSGIRQIRRNPGFAAAALLTLALGVGGVLAVFGLADPMLFRALPYADAERVFAIRVHSDGDGYFDGAVQEADVHRAASHGGFEALATSYGVVSGHLDGFEMPVRAMAVTRGFLDVFGVRPILGRGFLADEHRTRNARVALITVRVWQRTFGGRGDIIGETLTLKGGRPTSYQIVGVLPETFVFPDTRSDQPQLLVPGALDPSVQGNWRARTFPFARLKPGVSREAALQEMQALAAGVERDFPAFPQHRSIELMPIRERLFGRVQTQILILFVTTGCALLLACVNLAHLFLARLRARTRELGVRLALGAARWRVLRLLLIEALTIAVVGWLLALVGGQWVLDLILSQTPTTGYVYRLLPAHVDFRVAVFAGALVAIAVGIFGLIPALVTIRSDIRPALGGAPGSSSDTGRHDAILIAIQTMMAVALVVVGLLLVRSYTALANQPIGFNPRGLALISPELPAAEYWDRDRSRVIDVQRRMYERLMTRLPAAIATAGGIPGGPSSGEARPVDRPERPRVVRTWPVSGTFFDLYGVTLLRGRFFDDREAFSNAPVAVIDQRAADLLFGNGDPIGRHVRESDDTVRTVVGVVKTLRTDLLGDGLQTGGAFVPFGPRPSSINLLWRPGGGVSAADIRAVVHEVEPAAEATITPWRPFEWQLGQPRFLATVLGSLAVLTVALTLIGVFGVVSHHVARRTREVAIRMSFGADAAGIMRMVVGGALLPAAAGVGLGLAVSLWGTETLRSVLHGLQPDDPLTLAATAVSCLIVTIVASLAPAWRAARLDPAVVLKAE